MDIAPQAKTYRQEKRLEIEGIVSPINQTYRNQSQKEFNFNKNDSTLDKIKKQTKIKIQLQNSDSFVGNYDNQKSCKKCQNAFALHSPVMQVGGNSHMCDSRGKQFFKNASQKNLKIKFHPSLSKSTIFHSTTGKFLNENIKTLSPPKSSMKKQLPNLDCQTCLQGNNPNKSVLYQSSTKNKFSNNINTQSTDSCNKVFNNNNCHNQTLLVSSNIKGENNQMILKQMNYEDSIQSISQQKEYLNEIYKGKQDYFNQTFVNSRHTQKSTCKNCLFNYTNNNYSILDAEEQNNQNNNSTSSILGLNNSILLSKDEILQETNDKTNNNNNNNNSSMIQQNQSLLYNNSRYENGYYDMYEFVRKGQTNSQINFEQFKPFTKEQEQYEFDKKMETIHNDYFIHERTLNYSIYNIQPKFEYPLLTNQEIQYIDGGMQQEFNDKNILLQESQNFTTNQQEIKQKRQYLNEIKQSPPIPSLTKSQTFLLTHGSSTLFRDYKSPLNHKKNSLYNIFQKQNNNNNNSLQAESLESQHRKQQQQLFQTHSPNREEDKIKIQVQQQQKYMKSKVVQYKKDSDHNNNKNSDYFNRSQNSKNIGKQQKPKHLHKLYQQWQGLKKQDSVNTSVISENNISNNNILKSQGLDDSNQQIIQEEQNGQQKQILRKIDSTIMDNLNSKRQKAQEYIKKLEESQQVLTRNSSKESIRKKQQKSEERKKFNNISMKPIVEIRKSLLYEKKEPDSPKRKKSYFQQLQQLKQEEYSTRRQWNNHALLKKVQQEKPIFLQVEKETKKKRKSYFIQEALKKAEQNSTVRAWQQAAKIQGGVVWEQAKKLSWSERQEVKRKSYYMRKEQEKMLNNMEKVEWKNLPDYKAKIPKINA